MSNSYPRETTEFIPVTVTVDGVPVTTGVTFAVTKTSARPLTWVAPVSLDGAIGVMLTPPLTTGWFRVWAKIVDSPETPVVDCGHFQIT